MTLRMLENKNATGEDIVEPVQRYRHPEIAGFSIGPAEDQSNECGPVPGGSYKGVMIDSKEQ